MHNIANKDEDYNGSEWGTNLPGYAVTTCNCTYSQRLMCNRADHSWSSGRGCSIEVVMVYERCMSRQPSLDQAGEEQRLAHQEGSQCL